MKFKFPVQTKKLVNGKIKKQKGFVDFDIDTSVASQMRYEINFPDLAQHEDLYGYSQRIRSIEGLTTAKILSELKLLYCWIETELSFIEFLKLIDLTDKEFVEDFTKAITNAFDLILNSSAEKN